MPLPLNCAQHEWPADGRLTDMAIETPAHRAFATSIIWRKPDLAAAAKLAADSTPMDAATAMMLGLPACTPYAVAAAMVIRRIADFGVGMW